MSTSAHMLRWGDIQSGFDDTASLIGTKSRASPCATFSL